MKLNKGDIVVMQAGGQPYKIHETDNGLIAVPLYSSGGNNKDWVAIENISWIKIDGESK